MDELETIKATLNNTIARFAKKTQEYEVEIANLTAQVLFLQGQIESSSSQVKYDLENDE